MATRHNRTTLGTSEAAVEGTQYPGWILRNVSTAIIYLGDTGLTTSTGFPVDPGAIFSPTELSHRQLTGKASERLFGISGSASRDVIVLVPGQAKAI